MISVIVSHGLLYLHVPQVSGTVVDSVVVADGVVTGILNIDVDVVVGDSVVVVTGSVVVSDSVVPGSVVPGSVDVVVGSSVVVVVESSIVVEIDVESSTVVVVESSNVVVVCGSVIVEPIVKVVHPGVKTLEIIPVISIRL